MSQVSKNSKRGDQAKQSRWDSAGEEIYFGTMDKNIMLPVLQAIRKVRPLGLPDRTDGYTAEKGIPLQRYMRRAGLRSPQFEASLNRELKEDMERKRRLPGWQKILSQRYSLPAMAKSQHMVVLTALSKFKVLIICGQTGSGKSTQVPQMILDNEIFNGRGAAACIRVAEPRRISATSLARRVAFERNEDVGKSVGYHIRFQTRYAVTPGNITYYTEGVLWKMLFADPDKLLSTTSHIILDEVHERKMPTDLMLTTLRDAMGKRLRAGQSVPRLILMSATIDTSKFAKYFEEDPILTTGVIEIPGRTYPVSCKYLEDILPALQKDGKMKGAINSDRYRAYLRQELGVSSGMSAENEPRGTDDFTNSTQVVTGDLPNRTDEEETALTHDDLVPPELVAAAVVHVVRSTDSGDVLVFVPGMYDIEEVAKLLEDSHALNATGQSTKIFKLHSMMNDTNDDVFNEVPPGCRRIVVSTNIAETSITLPDIKHVVDTGTTKLRRLDRQSGSFHLGVEWATNQNIKQRLGRAGRTSQGIYYALYTRARHAKFAEFLDAEMVRADLASTALSVKSTTSWMTAESTDIAHYLSRTPDPPPTQAVQNAIDELKRLGALTQNEEMTPLGRTMSELPMEPRAAKAALLGVLFRCLDPMLIASVSENDGVIRAKRGIGAARVTRQRIQEMAEGSESDMIATINAVKVFTECSHDQARVQDMAANMSIDTTDCALIASSARQITETLKRQNLLPDFDMGREGFPTTPAELNVNSHRVPLIKSLLMLSMQPELAVRFSNGHMWYGRQGKLLAARSSVNEVATASELRTGKLKRPPRKGDLISYGYSQKVEEDKAAMVMSSMITPLMVFLFGDQIALDAKERRMYIDGLLEVHLLPGASGDTAQHSIPQRLNIYWEYRKMVERFQQTAWASLPGVQQLGDGSEEATINLFDKDNALRDAFIGTLIGVLEADAQADSMLVYKSLEAWLERDAAELEEREKRNQKVKRSTRPKKGVKDEAQEVMVADEVDELKEVELMRDEAQEQEERRFKQFLRETNRETKKASQEERQQEEREQEERRMELGQRLAQKEAEKEQQKEQKQKEHERKEQEDQRVKQAHAEARRVAHEEHNQELQRLAQARKEAKKQALEEAKIEATRAVHEEREQEWLRLGQGREVTRKEARKAAHEEREQVHRRLKQAREEAKQAASEEMEAIYKAHEELLQDHEHEPSKQPRIQARMQAIRDIYENDRQEWQRSSPAEREKRNAEYVLMSIRELRHERDRKMAEKIKVEVELNRDQRQGREQAMEEEPEEQGLVLNSFEQARREADVLVHENAG